MHEKGSGVDTYAIANQKGGVGKTTIALALAGELGRRNIGVLVIDLDPQASATKALGVEVDERPTVADVLLEPSRFALPDIVVTTDWGFDLAPAETALASRESRRTTADEFILCRQLEDRRAARADAPHRADSAGAIARRPTRRGRPVTSMSRSSASRCGW